MNLGVYRKVGIGDIENVRAGLLQVLAIANNDNAVQLAEEAIRAARILKKTLRIYFNGDTLSSEIQHKLCFEVFSKCRDYDLMLQYAIKESTFSWIYNRCDIVFDPQIVSGSSDLIVREWMQNGERELVGSTLTVRGYPFVKDKFAYLEKHEFEIVAAKFVAAQ